MAPRACPALVCRDFAGADLRLDAARRLRLLEMNPLPTFVADDCFGAPVEIEDHPPADLLAEVLAGGRDRLASS
jgi:D-alanine-D-alanine ligase